jgi:hypothetical protein
MSSVTTVTGKSNIPPAQLRNVSEWTRPFIRTTQEGGMQKKVVTAVTTVTG